MDYPCGEPGAAPALCERGAADAQAQPWDPAFDPSLPWLCFPQDSGRRAATNPNAGQVVGPTSCASQAAHASCLASSRSDRAAEWAVGFANEIVLPASPSTPSRINRVYVANRSCRSAAWNQGVCTPVHYPPSAMHPTGPIVHASLSSFPDSGANASSHTPQPVVDGVNLGSLQPTSGVPYYETVLDPYVALPTLPEQWIDVGNAGQILTTGLSDALPTPPPGPDTTFCPLGDDGYAGLSVISLNATSMPGFLPALPVGSPESHDAASNNGGLQVCTVAIDAAVPKACDLISSPPRSQPCKAAPRQYPTALPIIQCKPQECRGGEPPKKSLLVEVTPQGLASQTLEEVSKRDENGRIKGTYTTFGKRVRTRAPPSHEKRQQIARARKEGVCSRCKKSKRQVRALESFASLDHQPLTSPSVRSRSEAEPLP